MLCKECDGYRKGPCEDCADGECTLNYGPATVAVRGILGTADAEFEAAGKHAPTNAKEARAMRPAVRKSMIRTGLHSLWQPCRKDAE